MSQAKLGEIPQWVCEFCFKIYEGDKLPDDWDFAWQSAVCPDCIKRVAADGGYGVVPGGKYATGPDPRTKVPFPAEPPPIEELLADARHQNAVGKKQCGMCTNRSTAMVSGKQAWKCTISMGGPDRKHPESLPCPALIVGCNAFTAKPIKPLPVQTKPPRVDIPAGVRFIYFGRPRQDERHQGVMTVAYSLDLRNHVVQIGFSLCSLKDQWVKAKGQEIAIHRLLSFPITARYLYEPRRLVVHIAQALLEHRKGEIRSISTGCSNNWLSMQIPSWTLDLARRLKMHAYTGLTPRALTISKCVQAWFQTYRQLGPGLISSAIQAAKETKHEQ